MSTTNRKVIITGKVHQIGETKQVSDNFTIKEIVISVLDSWANGKSKQHFIPVQFSNQRISEIDSAQVGQEVEISAEVSGREWQGKYFTQITGWTCVPKSVANSQPTTPQSNTMTPNTSFMDAKETDYDLPF